MEASLVGFQAKNRNGFYLCECIVVHTLVVYRPVSAFLGTSFREVTLELLDASLRKDFVEAEADGVLLGIPKRVVVGYLQGLEVHEHLEFRQ